MRSTEEKVITGDDVPPPPLDREVDVLRQVIALVEGRLPRGWLVETKRESAPPGRRVDALITLVSQPPKH